MLTIKDLYEISNGEIKTDCLIDLFCFTLEETKNLLKELTQHHKYLMLPEDKNKTVHKKKIFLSSEIKDNDFAYEYLRVLHQYHMLKIKKERERAEKFINNEKEKEKAGWNYTGGKKTILTENQKKQLEWADKAYPNINLELWDTELEINMLKSYIKKFKG